MAGEAGKGFKGGRKVDVKKYDSSPLWTNIEKKKNEERSSNTKPPKRPATG